MILKKCIVVYKVTRKITADKVISDNGSFKYITKEFKTCPQNVNKRYQPINILRTNNHVELLVFI